MKLFGSPGTVSSLILRIGQFLSAAASFTFLVLNPILSGYTVYRGLAVGTLLQVLWSFSLMCFDVYALKHGIDQPNTTLLTIFVLGDWLVGGLLLAAACSSAAVTVLFARDMKLCFSVFLECRMSIISVALAFVGWLFIAVSALVLLWLRASI